MSTRVLHTVCPLDCPDHCSLEVTIADGRATRVDGDRRNPDTDGFICGKVRGYAEHVYHPTRLLHPLVRTGAKGRAEFRRASWDEALELVVARLCEVRERLGSEAILPLYYGGSNGRLTHGALDARFFRRLGASRLVATVCAAPTTTVQQHVTGRMPGVLYEDFEAARLIVAWGVNPAASGIHLVPHLRRAQAAGAKLVVVDPRRTKLARTADVHLAPRPGTDVVVALALIRWLFHSGRADLGFLERHTTGHEILRERAEPWTFERAGRTSEVAPAELESFARAYADASPALIRCGWGLERNRNGGSAVAAVLALPAVAGKFGVRGGGYLLSNSRAWQLAPAIDDPEPPTRRVNMNQMGRALCGELGLDPPIAALFVYDANPLATLPDQERVRRGLAREDLFTVVFDQVLTDTARHADVVLPATTFLEHDELSAGYGSTSLALGRALLDPVGESRPNYAVFAELIRRAGLARAGDEEQPDELAARVLRDDPGALGAVRAGELAFAPLGSHPVQFVDVFPRTSDQRMHLAPQELEREAPLGLYRYVEERRDPRFPLCLVSPATERTISSSLGELVAGPIPLELAPADARERGIQDGDRVRAWNALGEVLTVARVDPGMKPGVVFLPKGLWSQSTLNGATANALAPDSLTDIGEGACFNDARVQVERA
jgi:anaerobic selenocysteine-containing dehydrogenase